MNWTSLEAIACFTSVLAVAGPAAGESIAQSRTGRSVPVTAPTIAPASLRSIVRVEREVTLRNDGRRLLKVAASDFALSAQADIFAPQGWDVRVPQVALAPGRSSAFRLTFALPRGELRQAMLFYRPAETTPPAAVALNGSVARAASSSSSRSSTPPTINTFYVSPGVGEPWGTVTDGAGDVWFAEPGCDFAPTCGANAPPGQIGEIKASSHDVVFYTLPDISGNQPIFVTFDGSGNLWFTTPDNNMIGEFSPSTGQFIGQWSVSAGSGPWDLTFADGRIWYTEHLASAVGRFDPSTHAYQDFQTPSANSNPYGIAAHGGLIWFTENNSSVDRVGVLDTTNDNAISEYPIVQPTSGTPHMIAVDGSGHPWWTEGWSNTIATLNPAIAIPGQCGTTSGTCTGIERFGVPTSTSCSAGAHASGIAFQASTNTVWLDDSLTSQVGSFDPATGTFAMSTLSNCGAHPHDGLSLDDKGNVWFDEEFANAIGEIDAGNPPPPPPPPPPPASSPPSGSGNVSGSPARPPAQARPVSALAPTTLTAWFARRRTRLVRRRVRVHRHWRIVRVEVARQVKTTVERIRYGARTTVHGRLGTRDGTALRNQTVWILTAPGHGSNGFTYAAAAVTAANGTWTATLPPGPSRLVEGFYSGSPTTQSSASRDIRVIVVSKK